MKMTKLLPIAVAMMLVNPFAMAASPTSPSASSDLSLDLQEFIYIKENPGFTHDSVTEFNETYTTIEQKTPLHVSYDVITNKNGKKVKLSAQCIGESATSALYSDAAGIRIAFANEGVPPTNTAVANAIKGTPAKASNANVIAFTLTPLIKYSDDSAVTPATDKTDSITKDLGDGVTYTLVNGRYTFDYTSLANAVTDTFSTHDQMGTCKATLMMSQVAP